MNKIEEADFAWKAWTLLVDLETFRWERFKKQFLHFITEEQEAELMADPQPPPDEIPATDLCPSPFYLARSVHEQPSLSVIQHRAARSLRLPT